MAACNESVNRGAPLSAAPRPPGAPGAGGRARRAGRERPRQPVRQPRPDHDLVAARCRIQSRRWRVEVRRVLCRGDGCSRPRASRGDRMGAGRRHHLARAVRDMSRESVSDRAEGRRHATRARETTRDAINTKNKQKTTGTRAPRRHALRARGQKDQLHPAGAGGAGLCLRRLDTGGPARFGKVDLQSKKGGGDAFAEELFAKSFINRPVLADVKVEDR